MAETTIKLPYIKELEFLEDEHYYKVRNIFIPSVSSILSPISNQIYKDIDEEILNRARDRGTEVHLAIEVFDETGAKIISEEHAGYFEAYRLFRKEHPYYEVIASEYRVYEPTLWYAGTIDKILLDTRTNTLVLVDMKTSYDIEYAALIPQLTGYERACKAHKIDIKETSVLHLKSDGTYDYRHVQTDFDVFMSCLLIKKHIEKYKKRSV